MAAEGRNAPVEVRPLVPELWADLEQLFGRSGAYSGCWCMYWRVSSAEFAANGHKGNRERLRALADAGRRPGLIGYRSGEPVGWISLAPREEYGRLQRSPLLKPVDAVPVWAIVCFFVAGAHRGSGVAQGLLAAGIEYASSHGADAIEAFPRDQGPGRVGDPYAYMGTVSMFVRAGFREVARRAPQRPVLRLEV